MNSGEERAAIRQEFSPAGNCCSPEMRLFSTIRHNPSRRCNMVYGNEKKPPDLKVPETSPTETYVNDMLCLPYVLNISLNSISKIKEMKQLIALLFLFSMSLPCFSQQTKLSANKQVILTSPTSVLPSDRFLASLNIFDIDYSFKNKSRHLSSKQKLILPE